MIRKISLILITIICTTSNCYAGQWLFHHDKEISGQVVEADSRKPIEGALVITIWKLVDVVNEGPGGYDRVEVVESGKGGHFIIPSWFSFKPWQLLYKVENNSPYIFIFKPGFKVVDSNRPAREGFPGDTSISPQEREIIKKRYSLKPAALEKITNDKERFDSLELLSFIDYYDRHVTKKHLNKILNSYEIEANNLSNNEARKRQLLINVAEDKRRFLGIFGGVK